MRAALLGLAVGDALGVPVEFTSRADRTRDPVTGMRAFGTHHRPAGTWSDDTSLTCCLAESLATAPHLDAADLAERRRRWLDAAYWTAHHAVFDVGIATRQAIGRLRAGTPPAQAGGTGEYDNGNGALMRLLPLAFHPTWRADAPPADRLALTHRAARLTHGHPRSTVGCFLYLTARHLLAGAPVAAAYDAMRAEAATFLPTAPPPFAAETAAYEMVLNGTLPTLKMPQIHSSGYVVIPSKRRCGVC